MTVPFLRHAAVLAAALALGATSARAGAAPRAAAPTARPVVLALPRPDFRLPDTTIVFDPLETDRCLRCHGIPDFVVRDSVGGVARDLSVHVESFRRSEHGAIACRACHADIAQYPHRIARPRAAVSCGADCHARDRRGRPVRHQDTVDEYARSAHGGALDGKEPDGPDCGYCHGGGDPHAITKATKAYSAAQRTAMCAGCHDDGARMRRRKVDDGAVAAWRASVHGSLLRLGERDAPACDDCHDVHGVRASRDTAATTHAAHLPRTCGRTDCHEGAGAAIARAGGSHPGLAPARHPRLAAAREALGRIGGGVLLLFALGVALDAQRRLLRRRRPARSPAPSGPPVARIALATRLQHGALVASFTTLALTGLPLRFPERLGALARVAGGAGALRTSHRAAGVVLAIVLLVHLARTLAALVRAGGRPAAAWPLWPTGDDVREAWQTLLWELRLRRTLPAYGRHHFRQKAHYFAVLWGVPMMTLTGGALWLTERLAGRLPEGALATALLMHGDEALLAIGITLVWHMYQVHIAPGAHHRFLTWIDGRITRAHWLVQHPRDAERAGAGRLADDERTRLHEEALGAPRADRPAR